MRAGSALVSRKGCCHGLGGIGLWLIEGVAFGYDSRSQGHGTTGMGMSMAWHGNDTLIQCIRMYISILWVSGILQQLNKALGLASMVDLERSGVEYLF